MSCQCPNAQERQILRPSSDLELLQCRTKIKFYKRTEEARFLNLTECKHLRFTGSAVPHDSAWLCRLAKSADQTVIQISCFCCTKKYHTCVFWRDCFPARYEEHFLRGLSKIPEFGMVLAQGFWNGTYMKLPSAGQKYDVCSGPNKPWSWRTNHKEQCTSLDDKFVAAVSVIMTLLWCYRETPTQ